MKYILVLALIGLCGCGTSKMQVSILSQEIPKIQDVAVEEVIEYLYCEHGIVLARKDNPRMRFAFLCGQCDKESLSQWIQDMSLNPSVVIKERKQ